MKKLHLDTDIGGDLDDLCALAMVLQWPDTELVGVTTVADDRGRRAGYARYALDLAGHSDVPVAAGGDIAMGIYEPTPGLPVEADYWPASVRPHPGEIDEALDLLETSIEQGAIVAAIGPYTNLALLEQRSPGILARTELYLMGGLVYAVPEGFPPLINEMDCNVQLDAASSLAVFERARPTVIPGTVTMQTWLRRSYLPTLRAGGSLANLIANQAETFARDEDYETVFGQAYSGLPDDFINFLHDPLACAVALGWREGVMIETVPLGFQVEDGLVVERPAENGIPTPLVTEVDGQAFGELWLETVTG
jgi:inosine-uridine nucleoside N-ribohydrolase